MTASLDSTIDVRFRAIEAELYVTLDYFHILDQQFPKIAASERMRLEKELEGLDQEEFLATLRWIDEYVDEDLPRLYLSPILVQLWAVFESAIDEISKYLKEQQGQSLSIDDLRAANDFERAEKYYRDVLRFPLVEIDGAREQLVMLSLARNAIVHSNGRIEAIKPHRLQKLRDLEQRGWGVRIGSHHVSFVRGFVQQMAHTVSTVLESLIRRVREVRKLRPPRFFRHFQAAGDRFLQVVDQFVERITLSATRNGRHFGPKPALPQPHAR